jgi:hypothetical protein
MILAHLEQQSQLPEEQTYQAKLRAAAAGSVCEADAQAIVAGIVERAKRGDRHAIDQFFTHVLGAQSRPTKIVNQLVVPDVETAARISKR